MADTLLIKEIISKAGVPVELVDAAYEKLELWDLWYSESEVGESVGNGEKAKTLLRAIEGYLREDAESGDPYAVLTDDEFEKVSRAIYNKIVGWRDWGHIVLEGKVDEINAYEAIYGLDPDADYDDNYGENDLTL